MPKINGLFIEWEFEEGTPEQTIANAEMEIMKLISTMRAFKMRKIEILKKDGEDGKNAV
jgi:hypothetical protein